MCCCPLPSSSARSPANGSAIRSPPRRRRGCGWAVTCRWATRRASERSSSTRPKPRPCVASLHFIVSSAACAGSRRRPTRRGLRTKRSTKASGTERGGRSFSRGHIYHLLSNPIYIGKLAHKGQLYPGQHPALIDAETWTAVRDQLVTNATNHRRKADAAEPSLLAGPLTHAPGERFTPSHTLQKHPRYPHYVSPAPITQARNDHPPSWPRPGPDT